MKIVTFYSFRGGVGRSLAVANVSHLMVESRERRVLMVDFDLEAPGLSFMPYFVTNEAPSKGGIFEFMMAFQEGLEPDLSDYISSPDSYSGYLGLIRAGNLQSGEYSVGKISVPRLLQPEDGRMNFVTYFRKQVETLRYHYVTIDSRTGLTETSGLCTVALADLVIVLTGLNHQNQEGTKWVLDNLRQKPDGMERTIVAFSHVPNSEEDLKKSRIEEAKRFLELGSMQPLVLFYHPRVSLEEELFVDRWREAPLTRSYGQLAEAIFQRNPEDLRQLLQAISNVRWRVAPEQLKGSPGQIAAVDQLKEQSLGLYPGNARLKQALAVQYYELDKLDEAAQLFEQAVQGRSDFAEEAEPTFIQCLVRLGNARRLHAEFDRLDPVFRLLSPVQRQRAVELLAGAMFRLPDVAGPSRAEPPPTDEKKRADLKVLAHRRIAHLAESTARLDPQAEHLRPLLMEAARQYWHAWRIAQRPSDASKAVTLFEECIQLQPDDTNARNALGTLFWKSGDFENAAALFAAVIEQDPQNPTALSNDAELAVVQGRIDRFRLREEQLLAALPGEKPREVEYLVIMKFLEWLVGPHTDPSDVLAASMRQGFNRPVKWDFEDITPVLERVDESKKLIAKALIEYFKNQASPRTVREAFAGIRREPKLL